MLSVLLFMLDVRYDRLQVAMILCRQSRVLCVAQLPAIIPYMLAIWTSQGWIWSMIDEQK